MKLRLFALIAIVCWSGATLHGQDLIGTWQGTLSPAGNPLRLVLKIARAADGKFEGQLIAIDQGALPRTMTLISLDGPVVKWKVDALSATYEGTFTPDGNAINGSVTQTAAPQPLNFVRATPQTAWTIPEPTPPPKPMDPAADPGIEVATIKLSPLDARGRGLGIRGETMTVNNYSLLNLITFAYDLHEQQVAGGPAWKSTDRFEIVLKPNTPGQPNARQVRRLLPKGSDRTVPAHLSQRQTGALCLRHHAAGKHNAQDDSGCPRPEPSDTPLWAGRPASGPQRNDDRARSDAPKRRSGSSRVQSDND
jgi:hypothetical protein